jgi:hypothetical protein
MVVRDARVSALLRIERRVQLPRKRVDLFELLTRGGRDHLIPEQARASGEAQTRTDLERPAAIHQKRRHS